MIELEAGHRGRAEVENAFLVLKYSDHRLGGQVATTKTFRWVSSSWRAVSPARPAVSPYIFPDAGLGKPLFSSALPRRRAIPFPA